MFEVKMQGDAAEMFLYDDIGGDGFFGGISAQMFAEEMKVAKGAASLSVHINSAGGDVFDGVAIHSLLKNSGAKVTVYVDGLAASIASVIAMAGDEIVMRQGSMMMIHNPWSVTAGGAEDFRKAADVLDTIRDNIAGIYKGRTKSDVRNIRKLMDAETWLTADEAVAAGFATSVAKDAKAIAAKLDKRLFRNAPAEWLAAQEEGEPVETRVDPWKLRLAQRWQDFTEAAG